jgi:hypothetical protein
MFREIELSGRRHSTLIEIRNNVGAMFRELELSGRRHSTLIEIRNNVGAMFREFHWCGSSSIYAVFSPH